MHWHFLPRALAFVVFMLGCVLALWNAIRVRGVVCHRGGWHHDATPGKCSLGGYHPTERNLKPPDVSRIKKPMPGYRIRPSDSPFYDPPETDS